MSTRPFKLVNNSESQRLCERLSDGAVHWANEWLSKGVGAPDVSVRADVDVISEYRWTARQTAGAGIAVGMPANDTAVRLGLAGNAGQSSLDLDDPLFEELEKSAIRALIDSLLGSAE